MIITVPVRLLYIGLLP